MLRLGAELMYELLNRVFLAEEIVAPPTQEKLRQDSQNQIKQDFKLYVC